MPRDCRESTAFWRVRGRRLRGTMESISVWPLHSLVTTPTWPLHSMSTTPVAPRDSLSSLCSTSPSKSPPISPMSSHTMGSSPSSRLRTQEGSGRRSPRRRRGSLRPETGDLTTKSLVLRPPSPLRLRANSIPPPPTFVRGSMPYQRLLLQLQLLREDTIPSRMVCLIPFRRTLPLTSSYRPVHTGLPPSLVRGRHSISTRAASSFVYSVIAQP